MDTRLDTLGLRLDDGRVTLAAGLNETASDIAVLVRNVCTSALSAGDDLTLDTVTGYLFGAAQDTHIFSEAAGHAGAAFLLGLANQLQPDVFEAWWELVKGGDNPYEAIDTAENAFA